MVGNLDLVSQQCHCFHMGGLLCHWLARMARASMARRYFSSSGEGLVPPYRELHTGYIAGPLTPRQLKVLLDTRTRGTRGDTLAVLHRSRAGTKRRKVRTLDSLALHRIGDARLGQSSDGPFLGQVLAVPEKLRIVYFDRPIFTIQSFGRKGVSVEGLRVPYGLGENAGEIIPLKDGEYFQVELTDGKPAIVWSTGCSLEDVVTPILGRQRPAKDLGMVILRDANDEMQNEYEETVGQGTAEEIIAYILQSPADIAYAKVPFVDYTLVWRRDVRKFDASPKQLKEVSLVYSDLEYDFDEEVLAKTASPELAYQIYEVMDASHLLRRSRH